MTTNRYLQLDVFTDRPFGGNQLAVFPNGVGITSEMMQTIAREMAFSETTFVLPAEDRTTDFKVRIFTIDRELPHGGSSNDRNHLRAGARRTDSTQENWRDRHARFGDWTRAG
ncbi:MAG: PhzF family phenazine biosynthesis isomerase [Acidimicrobiia bacterium]